MMPFSDILKLSLSFRSIDISMAKELPAPVGEGLGGAGFRILGSRKRLQTPPLTPPLEGRGVH